MVQQVKASAFARALPRSNLFAFLVIIFATVMAGIFSFKATGFVPSIHDEISYLFQARTFLLGRLVNPPSPENLFFDMYHIINEKIFASKYFPGYAATLAPFVYFHAPYLNPLFFYFLQLILIFQIGKNAFGLETGWLALLLAVLSPQIFIQSTFLLSHLSSAVFLLLFLSTLLKVQTTGSKQAGILAGLCFGMALLIRPLSAAAFGAPIGIFVLLQMSKKGDASRHFKSAAFAIVLPMIVAVLLLLVYNKAVTGDYLKTPFSLYAETHAPYHRYGFKTWDKFAQEAGGPRVDKTFNEYYHNHTLADGFQIAGARLIVFLKWLFGNQSLGTFLIILWLINIRKGTAFDLLILSIWISLQAAHVPHWYPGILAYGSNYLYESAALLILSLAHILLKTIDRHSFLASRKHLILAGFLFICACSSFSLLSHHKPINVPRLIYRNLEKLKINDAVIFIRYADNLSMEWKVRDNVPQLDSALIFALDRGNENTKLRHYYPSKPFYRLDLPEGKMTRLPY